jgi:uncharacterized phiE125 gp8 family phage protein
VGALRIDPAAYALWASARVVVVTAATEEPLSLDEAKAQLRRDDDFVADDVLIASLVQAAREQVERDTGRALITQTLDLYFDEPPYGCELRVPRPKLQSVTSVKTYDVDHTETTLSTAAYYVDIASEPGRILLNNGYQWHSAPSRDANALIVRAVCGYGSRSAVPEQLKRAMALLISTLYEHREKVVISQFAGQFIDLPYGYEELIANYQIAAF